MTATSARTTSATVPARAITCTTPTPTITATPDDTVCGATKITLDAGLDSLNGLPYVSYLWSPGGETTQTILVWGEGAYSVNVIDANGCEGSASITITTLQPDPADFDEDCDVDLDDYVIFANCLTGPGGDVPFDCEHPDIDEDLDVDLNDFAALQEAFTGT